MNAPVPVIALDHPAALDVARVGRTAAALAAARGAGLPVRGGVVLTTQWDHHDTATALAVWRIISQDGAIALAVRPSSLHRERSGDGSTPMPVRIVEDAAALLDAAVAIRRQGEWRVPVLVHPHLDGPWHGELFADGSRVNRPVVVARRRSGDDWVAELDAAGRIRDVYSAARPGEDLDHPPVEVLARIARLAERVADRFDGPHDLEWLVDDAGRAHLLRLLPVARLHAADLPVAAPVGADDDPRTMAAA